MKKGIEMTVKNGGRMTEEHLLTLIRTSLEMHRYWCETGHIRMEDRDAMVAALEALDLLAVDKSSADPRPTEWTAHCPKFGSGESVDQRRGEPCPHCGDPRGHWPLESDRSEP